MSEQRKHWIEIIQKTSAQYDKTIMILSAGAIAISLTFLNNLVRGSTINIKWAILVSWIAFGCSLIFNLFSYLSSQAGYILNINELDTGERSKWATFWNIFTWALNILTLITFIVGVIFLCWFSYYNLEKKEGEVMSEEKKDSSISQSKEEKFGMPLISNDPNIVRSDKSDTQDPDKIEKGMPVVSNPPKPKKPETSPDTD